jgi:HD-GYP domain-containing protein (c-di-GMP phosphodiesterase class II)
MMRRAKRVDTRHLVNVVKGFVQGFRKNIAPIGLLATVKDANEYTFTHVVNVGILTIAQAERLRFSGKQLHDIGVAAMLHDVGKVFIPGEIIDKPAILTPEERTIMETHTIKGCRYLLGLDEIPKVAAFAAAEHHLKYNGSGYPYIKPGWRPSPIAQMIAIADIYDAMRSKRVYSDPKPVQLITQTLINEKGVTLNPFFVDNFLELTASGTREKDDDRL